VKVVFLQDVPHVARAGDVKEVADGYSRNYLIPKKLAAPATPAELKRLELLRQTSAQRQVRSEQEAEALAQTLKDTTLVFKVRAGAKDKLYGSVTSADIAKEIYKVTKHEVDKRKIELGEPIRELGRHQVSIKLLKDITATVTVVVEPEAEPETKAEKKPEKKDDKKQEKEKKKKDSD
jgi:large subunit ribosomal protein L9